MFIRFALRGVFVSGLLCAALAGQSTTPVPYQQKLTTALVGFTTNQTARLSVLNLNATPPIGALATAPCTVEMQFVDIGNNKIGTALTVPNFAPQAGVLLDLPRSAANPPGVASTPRVQIRGLVTVNPTAPAPGTAQGPCHVLATLEIVDANGSTVSQTTTTSLIGGPFASLADLIFF